MSDMREKQPDERFLDVTKDTFGAYTWRGVIEVFPYSGIKSEDVYARKLTVLLRAEYAREALGIVQAISASIGFAHDVYRTDVTEVMRVRA
jgi:hypothetical protein